MFFEIRGDITDVETFAIGKAIRELPRLRKLYGKGRWRKRKGARHESGITGVKWGRLDRKSVV